MIRLLLVDDQSLVRQGLKAILSLESDLEIVGMAENGEEAISQVEILQPDVVLMDYENLLYRDFYVVTTHSFAIVDERLLIDNDFGDFYV